MNQLSSLLVPSPNIVVNQVSAAKPKIDAVDLDEIPLTGKDLFPGFGKLKGCVVKIIGPGRLPGKSTP